MPSFVDSPVVKAEPSTAFRVVEVTPQSRSLLSHSLILGMLIGMGAFGIDLYLPAFGFIAHSLQISEGQVQLSLTSYFVALALGQLVYGPLSDRFGRRPPLIFGFALFIVASVGLAMTSTIQMLVALRFVQGIGACAGMVVSRAVVRDLRSGEEAAKLFASMLLVLGVSPILAPIVGSWLISVWPWQSVFWFLAALGAACLAVVLFFLEETNPPARRSGGLGPAFATYGRLIRDRPFVATVMVGGFSQGALFAYLAGSSFVYMTLHGVSAGQYSLLFAINAAALIGFAQFNVRLMRWTGALNILRGGTLVQTAAGLLLLVAAILHWDSVVVLACLLFLTVGCQGLLGPTSSVLALEPHAAAAGAASALMGGLQFGCGALASGLVSEFFNNTSVPMAAVIALCSAAGLLIVFFGSMYRGPLGAGQTDAVA